MTTIPLHPTDGPISLHFGLTYANYLVLPRTLLQSMPIAWQARFVVCLDELDAAFAHVPQAEAYEVIPGTEHIIEEMDDNQLAAAGVEVDRYGGERPPPKFGGEALFDWEEEHETEPTYFHARLGRDMQDHERVVIPGEDPVPHYNRGRTYIEPRVADIAAMPDCDPAELERQRREA